MSNVELITTIITSVLTIVGAVLGVLATKSEKAKKLKRKLKNYVLLQKVVTKMEIKRKSMLSQVSQLT